MFDLDDIKVPRSIVNGFIYDYDAEALESVIKEVNKQVFLVLITAGTGIIESLVDAALMGILSL